MTVSVVIPHWNRADLLVTVLGRAQHLRLPVGTDLEVIVVDNGSRDDSVAVAERFGARVIRLAGNEGVSRALNRGIEAARGEWIALLNNDVEPAENWLSQLLDHALRSNAWFATGKIYDAVHRDLLDGAGDAVCRGGAAWRLGHGKPDGPAFAQTRPTFFPSATATLFRRGFFERAGAFDEAFFAYLEDVDLGFRAAQLNLAGIYVPEARAWHRGSETGGRWSESSVVWITRHQLRLLAKHYSARMWLRFGVPVLISQLLWAGLAAARGRLRAWWRGIWLGLWDCRVQRRPDRGRGDGRLIDVLCAGEAEIAFFQASAGWDTYWKWYFRLAWPGIGKTG